MATIKTKNHERRGQKRTQGSKWIRQEKRLAIYRRDGFTCAYCGRDLRGADVSEITLDHVVPHVHGGSNKETNLVCACRSCNSARGEKKVAEFATPAAVAEIRRRVRRSLKAHLVWAKENIAAWKAGKLEIL